jgi:hypothetical protein
MGTPGGEGPAAGSSGPGFVRQAPGAETDRPGVEARGKTPLSPSHSPFHPRSWWGNPEKAEKRRKVAILRGFSPVSAWNRRIRGRFVGFVGFRSDFPSFGVPSGSAGHQPPGRRAKRLPGRRHAGYPVVEKSGWGTFRGEGRAMGDRGPPSMSASPQSGVSLASGPPSDRESDCPLSVSGWVGGKGPGSCVSPSVRDPDPGWQGSRFAGVACAHGTRQRRTVICTINYNRMDATSPPTAHPP